MLAVRDRLMCHVVWPVCRRMPVWMWVAVAYVAAVPYAIRLLLSRRWLVHGAAQTIGCDTFLHRWQLAYQMAWYRLRYLDFYFYEGVPHLKVIWPDGEPETERCLYVLSNMHGSEAMTAFMDRHPAVMVRSVFGGEGRNTYATAPTGFRWWGHLAEVREKCTRGRLLATNGPLMQYRKLFGDPRSVVIYQDLWHTAGRHQTSRFLGHDVPLKLGAVKLVEKCGDIPIRFVSIRPEGNTWIVRPTPRLPKERAADLIVQYMEAEVLARPGAWEQWEIFLEKFVPSVVPADVAIDRPPASKVEMVGSFFD